MKSPASIAQRVVADYYKRHGATIDKIVERDSEAFEGLIDAISGTSHSERVKEHADVEQRLRDALPELHADFEKLSDLHAAELNDYLEAGYLIGFAVAMRGGAR